MRRVLVVLALLSSLPGLACESHDPKQELELTGLETYWAVDSAVGARRYIAPVARFQLRNLAAEPLRTVQATATFRRKGEEQLEWGSAWEQVTPVKKPLAPGQTTLVLMKSDGRYYSEGDPHQFFEHAQFKDARVTVYLRVGSSPWVQFAEADVERRIGTRAIEGLQP